MQCLPICVYDSVIFSINSVSYLQIIASEARCQDCECEISHIFCYNLSDVDNFKCRKSYNCCLLDVDNFDSCNSCNNCYHCG